MPTAKIAAAASAALLLPVILTAAVVGALSAGVGGGSAGPSRAALDDIPAEFLTLYRQAASACPGLDWAVLAAIGKTESDHGRSRLPGVATGTENAAGAGVISGSIDGMRHVRIACDTPRAGEVSAGCES